MKKTATAEADKKSGKIYECGYCGSKCSGDAKIVEWDAYMGQRTNKVHTSYYCDADCRNAGSRETLSMVLLSRIDNFQDSLTDRFKDAYLKAICGLTIDETKDEKWNEKQKEKVIVHFGYITTGLAFFKALLARKSSQELELKWFKFRKFIGERLEVYHDDAKALSLHSNELTSYGTSPAYILAFASD